MNNKRKMLVLFLCTVALVTVGIFGTLAYFTDSEAVTNTFTVGQVGISLDEAKVEPNGTPVQGADRVTENKYHLLPGYTYTKDPIVHIDDKSDSCWVFVKVENGIANIEAGTNPIASQITVNGWTELDGVENVYYRAWNKGENKDLPVFASFTIDGAGVVNGTEPDGYTGTDKFIGDYAAAEVKVTAYAVQKAGFENSTPKEIWGATFGK